MPAVSRDETEALTTKRGGSRLKKAAIVVLLLLIGLAASVYFGGPAAGSAIAKSVIARTLDDGTVVTVGSVSLSWGGPQKISRLTLQTPDAHEAVLDGTLDRSLMTLLKHRGRGDLGTLVLTGRAVINGDSLRGAPADQKGTPASPSSGTGSGSATGSQKNTNRSIALGSGFSIAVELKELDLTINSTASPSLTGTFAGSATARAGEPAIITLAGALTSVKDQSAAGAFELDLRSPDLIAGNGSVSLAGIPALAGSAKLTTIPAALLQSFLPEGTSLDLARVLGESVTATMIAAASPGNPTAVTVDVRSSNATAHGSFTLDGSLVRVDPAIGFSLGIARLSPTLAGLLGEESPVTIGRDGGATLTITSMSVDLGAIAQSGLFGDGAIEAAGEIALSPVTATITGKDERIASAHTTGQLTLKNGTLRINAKAARVSFGTFDQALSGLTIETTTSLSGEPKTSARLTVDKAESAAIGAWLGEDTAAGSKLIQLDDTVKLVMQPTLEGGKIKAPFTLTGTGYEIGGMVSMDNGELIAEASAMVADTGLIDSLAGLEPGLAGEFLGPAVTITANLSPTEAVVSVISDRLMTAGPVRVTLSGESLSLAQPVELRAQITPEALAMLRKIDENDKNEAAIGLAEPVSLTVRFDSFTLPMGEGATLAVEATATAESLKVARPGEATSEYSGFEARASTIEGQPNDLKLAVRLQEQGREVVLADLIATGLVDDHGVLTPDQAGFTGPITLTQAGTLVLDMLIGSSVTSNLLGPTLDADLQFDDFPQDGGTVTGTITSPRASGEIHAVSNDGEIVLTQPARFELREITERFSYQFTPLIPVVGAFTKDAQSHRPTVVSVESLILPVPFDLRGLGFNATIDPGTASIVADNELTKMLQGGQTIGDSFAPFTVRVSDGVLEVTGLTIPIGEFEIPATGTYDLVNRLENVFVQLPTGALLSEAIGGKNDIAGLLGGRLLGRFIQVGLRKSGTLGGKNPWEIDTSTSIESNKEPEKEIIDTVRDLIDIFGG